METDFGVIYEVQKVSPRLGGKVDKGVADVE